MTLTGTVLILDDSLTVRMDLVEAFTQAGWRTAPCATAAQAWEVLAGSHVDAIVLDVLLPDADGVDVLHDLRGRPDTSSVPVLMLSTEAQVKDRIRGLRTGADEYVGKPYDSAYLVARAQELVHHPAVSAGSASAASTVLVIAPASPIRDALQHALDAAGHAIVVTATGMEGLRVAAARRADAVVVDGALPDIEATTVIRRLRLDAALRGAFCLLVTRSNDVSVHLYALESGADAFSRDDDPVEVIAAKVSAALRQATAGSPLGTTSLLAPKKILSIGAGSSLPALLTDRVRGEGYDVVPAGSGADALELLAIQSVDCILLQADASAAGQDALQLCRRIKSVPELRDIPLLLLSRADDQELMVDALAAGADDYLRADGDFEVLAARIRAQLRRKQLQDEHRQIRETLLRKEIDATQARAQARIAETRAAMVEELERKNQELETFSYSVSHDLRAPLRTVGGFTSMLVESLDEYLDDTARHYVDRINGGLRRMTEMIDDLLELSRVGRAPVQCADVDLAELAGAVLADLAAADPERKVITTVQSPLHAYADRRLMQNVLENLLGNAWKFTAHASHPTIEVGSETGYTDAGDEMTLYVIRDNGDGFDMGRAQKLFSPFQRFHHQTDFPGTGIGLATVHRIIDRHGGRVWADAQPGQGATFRFTLRPRPPL